MGNDTYKPPITIKVNNVFCTVYSPVLTDEEREKRMNAIKKAAVRLLSPK